MTTIRKPMTALRGPFLAAVLLGAGACGSDTVVSPTFGAACNVGSIAAGQTIESALTPASCTAFHFYSTGRVPYESYTLSLTKGKAYLLSEQQIPDPDNGGLNEVDALLTLWGKNESGTSVPLALSDDQADGIDGHDSQIWFIAPESGTYQLVAASYWGDEYGGYRLSARECPILATLDTAGTYNLTLGNTSPCVRISPATVDADTARMSMLRIPVVGFEQVTVTVTSAAFVPAWEMFGPGFDVYSNIYDVTDDTYGHGTGSSGSVTMAELGGDVTLSVGGDVTTASGAFTVVVARSMVAAPGATSAPWSMQRIALSPMRSHAPKVR